MDLLISLWPIWLLGAGAVAVYAYQSGRDAIRAYVGEVVVLQLEIPRANDKKELAAEQMFAALHGILRTRKELMKEGEVQEHLSFELAAIGKRIRFYVAIPKHLQNFVEGQIYAQYPTAQIYVVPTDYASREITQPVAMSTELVLTDNEALPIKTFQSFEVDPLAAITATLAKLEQDNEEMWIQILARPIDDSWHRNSSAYVSRIKKGKGILTTSNVLSYIGQMLWLLFQPPEQSAKSGDGELSERDKSRVTAIEEKSKKLGYHIKVRIVYLGNDATTARLRIQAMVGTFKQFNTTNLNGFKQSHILNDITGVAEYQARHFIDKGFVLNIEELASLYHLPHTNVETPNIIWATSKTAEPPPNLPVVGTVPPEDLSPFGTTNFRGIHLQFGLKRRDRGRHLYIIGQTGTGKSGLLELLTLSDVFSTNGFAVIDPHGDYAQHIIDYIPAHRVEDVIYFNPADREFPVGFNPLEVTDPSLKNHISSELVGVLKRMFESWGPRLEYILRYTILALLDYPDSTMLDITRMLTEKKYRDDVISHVSDPVVRNFWTIEFASWNDKFASEAVAPVLNKIGAFTANPMIRNIIGQPKSTINIRGAMDNGKILIVNLSRGLVGEDNAAILGALMVTKIQLAAMSRADIANIEDRKPFYLYVDEFQNFATDSFATILSEARKYGLNLTVANQYTSQMEDVVKDAVFGNVGGIISFRVGPEDADSLVKYFTPQFEAQDLIQLHNRHFLASLNIEGEKAPAFSATTLNLPPAQATYSKEIAALSRQRYALPREEVEASILAATQSTFVAPNTVREQNTNNNQRNQPRPKNQQQPSNNQQQPKNRPDNQQGSRSGNRNNRNSGRHQEKPKNKPEFKKPKNDGSLQNDDVIRLR